jgi:hypothetical protein
MCQLKWFTPLFSRICSSQEVGQVSNQTALQGAIQNMPGDHSNDHLGFLTILDKVLTVSGSAGVKSELAGLRLNQEASQKALEELQRMTQWQSLLRRSGGSKSAAKNTSAFPGPMLKKQIINMPLSITFYFY